MYTNIYTHEVRFGDCRESVGVRRGDGIFVGERAVIGLVSSAKRRLCTFIGRQHIF